MTDQKSVGAQAPGFYRFKVGAFDVIALHDGVISRDRPPGFVPNASDEEVADAFAAAGMPRDKLTITFTALAIQTGDGVVLIDTGFGDSGPPGTGHLVSNLAAAGIQPGEVGTVIISHFHGDHISGLRTKDGALTFPNAELLVPSKEWDFWMDDANASNEALKGNIGLCHKMFDGLTAKQIRHYEWDEEMLPGFTAVRANGHTPGMSAIQIASGDSVMMFVADITNNPLIFARHPDWRAMFDMDPQETIATRKRLLDQAATDRMRLSFFHAPFPATGYVVRSGSGFEYLPALWMAP